MLQIKSVTSKQIYEVVIEFDNNDGKGKQTVFTLVEKTQSGYIPLSHEDSFVINGTYGADKQFSKEIEAFMYLK